MNRCIEDMRRGTGSRRPNAQDRIAEVARQDRRAMVLSLTVDGLSTRQIGARLGIGHVQVQRDLKLALDERASETRESARALAKERLESIIAANMPTARGEPGLLKVDSAKVVLSAIALDAKINGLEAPKQIEHSGRNGKPIEIDVTSLTNEQLAELCAGALASEGGSGTRAAPPSSGSEPAPVHSDADAAVAGPDAPDEGDRGV